MKRAQRRVSKKKKGSKRRKKAVVLLAKKHEHVANIRRQNHIDVANALVKKADVIYVEKLNLKGLGRGVLAKSFADAALGDFRHWLDCKAEEAGRTVVEVDPRGTSKTCSRCGCVGPPIPLSTRVFRCAECGFVEDRDVNAAVNIRTLGQSVRRAAALSEARL